MTGCQSRADRAPPRRERRLPYAPSDEKSIEREYDERGNLLWEKKYDLGMKLIE